MGAESEHGLDVTVYRCFDQVSGPQDVGLDCLEGIVLRRRHLLYGGGVYYDVHSIKGPIQPISISHIPQEKSNSIGLIITKTLAPLELLDVINDKNE